LIADAYSLYAGFYFLAGIIISANLLVFFMPKDAPLAGALRARRRWVSAPRDATRGRNR